MVEKNWLKTGWRINSAVTTFLPCQLWHYYHGLLSLGSGPGGAGGERVQPLKQLDWAVT